MSLYVEIDITGLDSTGLGELTAALQDREPMHQRMAADVGGFVQAHGREKSKTEHRTANILGAKPTGHLERAYAGIEDESDASGMRLLIPRDSRLRAAFGSYTLKPKRSKYLTIPTHKDSYGRRAGELENLTFIRLGGGGGVGTGSQALLIRKDDEGKMEVMYFLTTSSEIKEDPSLLPFSDIAGAARDSAESFYDELIEEALLS